MSKLTRRIKNSPYLISYYSLRVYAELLRRRAERLSRKSTNVFLQSELLSTHATGLYNEFNGINDVMAPRYEELELLEKVQSNERFKDLHRGKRCFVLGNGPSLKEQDLSLIANEITFTVNKLTYFSEFDSIETNYHFWADPSFFMSSGDPRADEEQLKMMLRVSTNDNQPECFIPSYYYDFAKAHGLEKKLKLNLFTALTSKMPPVDYDFSAIVSGGQTVVHTAILLALYMGFKEIYLLGCESTGIVTTVNAWLEKEFDENDYAYRVSENSKKILYSLKKHYKMEDEFLGFYQIFKNYRILGEYCAKHEVYLCNCTKGGILDTLPRESYEDVIRRKEIN